MAKALDSEETEETKKARNRLRDLSVPDVDIVDRPANRRRFLIVKKEDGMPQEAEGSEFATGDIDIDLADPESGTPPKSETGTDAAPEGDGAPPKPPADDHGEEDVAKAEAVRKAAEAHAALLEEKVVAIKKVAEEISTGAATMDAKDLKAKIGQLERLGWKVEENADVVSVSKSDSGDAGEDVAKAIPTPVRDEVVRSLREAAERLMSVNVTLQAATVTQDKVAAPLPDAVAREVKAIRTKVSSVLQRYPQPSPSSAAKTDEPAQDLAEVGYEAAHELMKQASAITLPAPVRDAVSGKVRGATELLLSVVAAVQKMQTTEERMPNPLPAETAEGIRKALGIFDEILKKYPAPAAKSDDAIEGLRKHFKAIEDLVSGLAGGAVVVKEEPAKAADPRLDDLVKRVDETAELVKKMAGTPASSNALPDEGKTTVAKGEETEWPLDMASDRK